MRRNYKSYAKKLTINPDKEEIASYITKHTENNQCVLPDINYSEKLSNQVNFQNLEEFYTLSDVQNFKKRIFKIRNRRVKPILNTIFLENQERLLQIKQNYRELEQKSITLENQKIKNKILNARSLFLHFLGKEVVKTHDELIEKICKRPKKIFLLPKIDKKKIFERKRNVDGSPINEIKSFITESNISDIESAETFDLNQQSQGVKHLRSNSHYFGDDIYLNKKNCNIRKNDDDNIIKIDINNIINNCSNKRKSDDNIININNNYNSNNYNIYKRNNSYNKRNNDEDVIKININNNKENKIRRKMMRIMTTSIIMILKLIMSKTSN